MAVGFDIDDTLLFSSPGLSRQAGVLPNGESYLKNPAFWEKMSNGWDAFSVPKEVAKALIAMHPCAAITSTSSPAVRPTPPTCPLPLAGAWGGGDGQLPY